MGEFFVVYSEFERQMRITNPDIGDRVLVRRRELVDSVTNLTVADKVYDGKPWVDISEEDLMQGAQNVRWRCHASDN